MIYEMIEADVKGLLGKGVYKRQEKTDEKVIYDPGSKRQTAQTDQTAQSVAWRISCLFGGELQLLTSGGGGTGGHHRQLLQQAS